MSYFLPLLVGHTKARELMFTAQVITGEQALALGMINQSVTAEAFPQAVQAMAAELASLPTVALGYMKKNLNASNTQSLSQILDSEAMSMARCFTTAPAAQTPPPEGQTIKIPPGETKQPHKSSDKATR